MNTGKSIRLFLVDGTPGGLLTAEIMNWTGHIVSAPRSELAALLKRPETSRTGIYILIGDDPDSIGGLMAYIGEGDDVGKRLYHHARPELQDGKDFWDRAIVLTSKDTNLTKAHARYLESRFIALGWQANRAKLTNSTAPDPITLPEADVSDMEYFIEQARIVLPVLGLNIFRIPVSATSPSSASQDTRDMAVSPIFELRLKKDGIVAKAQEIDGEFTILAESNARLKWTGAGGHSYRGLREILDRDGTLAPSPDGLTMRFTRNQVFASPSAAAAVVTGRSANGRNEWATAEGRLSYGDWQRQGVDEALEGDAA
jgi:Domain of unknown function (DUF4357)